MNESGEFYIVSTPIGNLSDVSLRALEVLRKVDYVVCEDTRVTIKLLNKYEIKKPLISFHAQSAESALQRLLSLVAGGSRLALVSDSGTPLISDPGSKLVQSLLEKGVRIIPVPGPSAVQAALSASGFAISDYLFAGFLSSKAARRRKRLVELKAFKTVIVFFESPHRILSCLEDAAEVLGDIKACVAKEMTKKFEKYYRGTLRDIIEKMKEDGVKGEYTVVIDNR